MQVGVDRNICIYVYTCICIIRMLHILEVILTSRSLCEVARQKQKMSLSEDILTRDTDMCVCVCCVCVCVCVRVCVLLIDRMPVAPTSRSQKSFSQVGGSQKSF